MIVLVVGGTRSGKSGVAERLAARLPAPHAYLATGRATDPMMASRIDAHRATRPEAWTTVEAGDDLAGSLAVTPGTALVDSLGTWVAAAGPAMDVDPGALVAALRARSGDTVVVTEEVGLAVHPVSEAGRRFVDVLGACNQAVAAAADHVLLVVSGRVLALGTASGALDLLTGSGTAPDAHGGAG